MPATSKTGLLPAICHIDKYEKTQISTIELPKFIMPAPFVLRPFAGVYNPFPYGCSVLCNHPADYEAKDVVRKAKESWVHDGKALTSDNLRSQRQSRADSRVDEHTMAVPEELFRKYTDTDSRPITPAPTVVSTITRSSHARRCMTPDPIPPPGREKTLLVLDLRRSHSQETLNWLGSQAGLPSPVLQGPTPVHSRSASSVGAPGTAQSRKKKPLKGRNSATLLRTESSAIEPEEDAEASLKLKQQVLTNVKTLTVEGGADGQRSDRSGVSSTGGDVVKRRGKKKKGKKEGGENGREGEKEFRGLPDPGETQVSALGESRGGSTRPSLTPGALLEASEQAVVTQPTTPKSFLTPDLLKQLQRQLDQQDVESEFDSNKKKALEEAFRTRPPAKQRHQCEELKALKKILRINESGTEKWLNIPRVFSRQSTRFELPMDTSLLTNMSCMQYASQCTYPSKERIVIYNQIFNLYREELDEDEQVERSLLGKNLIKCLEAVMGRTLQAEEVENLRSMFGISDTSSLNFRTFAGVAAVCERLLGKPPPRPIDLPTTLEQSDFRCLSKIMQRVTVNPPLAELLTKIRDI